jgi:ribulose-phosphate 3-epimerase
MSAIIPAIIPKSFEHLTQTLDDVRPFAHAVQVDIVDGIFVPFTSWPYVGSGNIQLLTQFREEFEIEVDLMLTNPQTVIDVYAQAGAKRIVVHLESTHDIDAIFAHHEAHSYMLGISILNDTPLQKLTELLPHVDYVQLMGIAKIGSQGQPFDERVLERVSELHAQYPELLISIDGSVNAETLPRLRKAGARRFVSGSAILSAPNPYEAFRNLESLASLE